MDGLCRASWALLGTRAEIGRQGGAISVPRLAEEVRESACREVF
jgi:hypothetical protein